MNTKCDFCEHGSMKLSENEVHIAIVRMAEEMQDEIRALKRKVCVLEKKKKMKVKI